MIEIIKEIIIVIILTVNALTYSNTIVATTQTQPLTPTVADAKRYAREQLGAKQFACLDALFQRESRWRVNALNKRSGAYGIPQALPGSKMRTAGKDWRTNPITQVKWGIKYIRARYGTACKALQHAYDIGWY